MKKYLAEMVGPIIFVLFGCGTTMVAGDDIHTGGLGQNGWEAGYQGGYITPLLSSLNWLRR